MTAQKFVAIFDTHYGFQRLPYAQHRLLPIHNQPQIDAVLKFTADFKPDIFIAGGDIVDCGPVSHWNKNKRLAMEGMRLGRDLQGCKTNIIQPINAALKPGCKKHYLIGNHEDWLNQFVDEHPGISDLLDIDRELELSKHGWEITPQGEHLQVGKLLFMHGDTVGGGEYCAKKAVSDYEMSVRFGHWHTLQIHTKTSRADAREVKTGVAVPCLSTRRPGYGKGKPNKWINGFLYGWINSDGTFHDFPVVIVRDRFTVNGTTYKG